LECWGKPPPSHCPISPSPHSPITPSLHYSITPLKILHLFGDWKWTGPAEPVVRLCAGLRQRGHEVLFACKKGPAGYPRSVETMAAEAGLKPITSFRFNKRLRLGHDVRDVSALLRLLNRERPDIVHVHQRHEHFVAGAAARRARRPVALVRTDHTAEPPKRGLVNRTLLGLLTDGFIVLSEAARAAACAKFGLAAEQVVKVDGAVDVARFDGERKWPDLRPSLGLQPSDVVVAIVARVQRHRRFDVFLKAMALAAKKQPNLRALIVGRGTHIRDVAVEPARRLGLADKVIFPGYRGEDYPAVLAAMDMKVFLVPGSDGSCRAVREAMAMGKPVIAARRGMLPEIVDDGVTGLVIDDTPENLAHAILRLAGDARLRHRLGRAGMEKARRAFSLAKQVHDVERFYAAVLAHRRTEE